MAAPAVLRRNILHTFAVSHFNFFPEGLIQVGIGRFMAPIAIHLILGRMLEARHIPGLYAVTFPAFASEEPSVDIGMTACAWELAAEKRMIRL